MSFSQRLTELMNNQDVSAYRMAKDIGTSDMNVSRWKSGKAMPNLEMIAKLAERLNVTTDYLINGNEQKNKPTTNSSELPAEILDAAKILMSLPEPLKQREIEALKTLYDAISDDKK